MPISRLLPIARVLPLLAIAGCRPGTLHPDFAMSHADHAPIVVQMVRVTDSHVAGLALLGNNVELSYATIGLGRAANPDLKAYAHRMIADHAGLNTMLNDVLGRMDMKASDDSISTSMRETSGVRRDQLRATPTGQEFDVAYATLEVRSHREMLELIGGLLLPSASKGDLRQYLEWLLPTERAHLANAEQLLSTLSMRP